ncbi:MAG: nucleoside triphosphate pyrophosphohydrolase [Solirubrobacteraceae bacterium]|nr:nucleoside triphosphate pyrophosphohydrolase [Solirubrobacteraceae bacterium]
MPRDDALDRIPDAVGALDALTRRLRADCPWDREQDERSIVPHTLEEAYELADAANAGDDAKLLDELGDVLFQVHFLSLLLEERGAGDMAAVADACRTKLVRRHPHVFGPDSPEVAELRALDAAAAPPPDLQAVADADDVLANWDRIKGTEAGRERGIFGEVPDNLPSLLFARKLQRRAASSGFDPADVDAALQAVRDELERLEAAHAAGSRPDVFAALGDALFALTNVARKAKADPEIALRSSASRFRARVLRAEALALEDGRDWAALDEDRRLGYYARAALEQAGVDPTGD